VKKLGSVEAKVKENIENKKNQLCYWGDKKFVATFSFDNLIMVCKPWYKLKDRKMIELDLCRIFGQIQNWALENCCSTNA
jgi:hypothetical protein